MSPTLFQQATATDQKRALCVDLDGTLVKSDTLVDSALLLVRTHPLVALKAPLWLFSGKAGLKREVASRVILDVARLPYNQALVTYLREEKEKGRRIFLVTGADHQLASSVAAHLDLFEGVLGSNGVTNLTGINKLQALRQQFGADGFDYIGNAHADIPLFQHAGAAMTANPVSMLDYRLRAKGIRVERSFDDRSDFLRTIFKAIRIHQWAKNALLFVPLLLAHALHFNLLVDAVLAFLCFSLCASSTYIINDLLDMDADRKHPRRRWRPFASGDLPVSFGILVSMAFLVLGIWGAHLLLTSRFLVWLLLYLAATLSYSLYLKRVVLVDVILLAGLYTVRVLAGGAATHTVISPWLSAFSVFLFLSLAIVKRFSELQNAVVRGATSVQRRGYLSADLEQLRSFGSASAYASVVVFALYINGHEVTALYHHPNRLWLVTPMLLWWVSRVWLLASRGSLNEDPVIFALTDRVSLLIGIAVVLIAALATF